MKTIMHPDYWVEIPAGECIIGLSMEQREKIWAFFLKESGYEWRNRSDKAKMRAAVEKWRHGEPPTSEEGTLFYAGAKLLWAASLHSCPPQRVIWLDRFYIARFPVTDPQFARFNLKKVSSAKALPGMLDTPEFVIGENGTPLYLRYKGAAAGMEVEFCKQLGARFPTTDEWEKAARGTDGRLYPWGNEWNAGAGYFSRNQRHPKAHWNEAQTPVDAHPEGVSPYGVWHMAGGGYTEIRTEIVDGKPRKAFIGWSPRDSTLEAAPFIYLAANRSSSGEWRPVALRPVLDEWPVQQWQGVELDGGEK